MINSQEYSSHGRELWPLQQLIFILNIYDKALPLKINDFFKPQLTLNFTERNYNQT